MHITATYEVIMVVGILLVGGLWGALSWRCCIHFTLSSRLLLKYVKADRYTKAIYCG